MINDVVNGGFPARLSNPPAGEVVAPAAVEAKTAQAAAAEAPPPEKPATADPQRLEQAVSKLNDYVQNYQRKLSFSVSAETGRTIIKVYDAETDELIRQIPPEETIKLAESIDSKVSSLFVQERA